MDGGWLLNLKNKETKIERVALLFYKQVLRNELVDPIHI
jgi:hypothetical protein